MSVCLEKGHKVSLTKDAPGLDSILIGLGWDANKKGGLFGSKTFDLDASAFVLRDGKIRRDNDVIYFGNKHKRGDAIWHHGDNLTGDGDGDDEQISVTLSRLDRDIDRVIFVVNIYDAKSKRQSFGDVKNAFMRIVDEKTNRELFRYNLSDGSVGDVTSLIFGELYKKGSEWKFNPIGEGSKADTVSRLAAVYR